MKVDVDYVENAFQDNLYPRLKSVGKYIKNVKKDIVYLYFL